MHNNWPEKYQHFPTADTPSERQELDLLYKFSELNYPEVDVNEAWDKVNSKIGSGSRPIINFNLWWRVAAILVVAAGVTFSVLQYAEYTPDPTPTEVRALDSRKAYQLPDGSVITLSANSTMSFDENDFIKNRKIKFQGEGFFEITKRNSTFSINTPGGSISVLGTSFNLEATDEIEVFVQSGLVAVETEKSKKQVAPGQLASTNRNGEITVRKNTDPNVTSWKTGIFTFDNTELSEALPYLEKYYQVSFNVSPELSSCNISVQFEKRPLNEVVDVLSTILGAKSKISTNEVKFTGTGCK